MTPSVSLIIIIICLKVIFYFAVLFTLRAKIFTSRNVYEYIVVISIFKTWQYRICFFLMYSLFSSGNIAQNF